MNASPASTIMSISRRPM